MSTKILGGTWLVQTAAPIALIALLSGCEDAPSPPDHTSVVGTPSVVATPSNDVAIINLHFALGADGATAVAGWTELYDRGRIYSAVSTDGAVTFGTAAPVDDPEDAELTSQRLWVDNSGGIWVGALAYTTDDEGLFHSDARVYKAAGSEPAFSMVASLKEQAGDRSFSQIGFAASADGQSMGLSWIDTTPEDWLTPESPPGNSLLSSTSTDGGKTFGDLTVVSTTPFTFAPSLSSVFVGGQMGLVYGELREVPGQPIPVGMPAFILANEQGVFGEPVLVAPDEYGAIPAGSAAGTEGAAPAAAIGPDGSIHVAWWSAMTVGLWYSTSADGLTFSEPIQVMETAAPTPANVRIAVDGLGNAWVAALDQGTVRVVEVVAGAPAEIVEASQILAGDADLFDIAPLPDHGAVLLWLAPAPEEDPEGLRAIQTVTMTP
ncbi:MAG: hypothetical protein IPK82_16165 [Polyangiaceae bacterium]|nr:hypothetical protein [Polyangiaceae bacterium]